MSFRLKLVLVFFLGSVVAGWITAPLRNKAARIEEADRGRSDRQSLASLSGGLGGGLTLATLGGYRTITANLVWISMYGDWQYRRLPEVLSKMKLAVSLNPDSEFFWIDGARIIANDLPVWEVGDEKMETLFRTEEGIAVRKDYGRRALRFLESAPEYLQNRAAVLVEMGTIAWKKLDDLPLAIDYFQAASLTENAPFYVFRVYAELLVLNGETKRALDVLEAHFATLPENDPRAMRLFVAGRIRDLKQALGAN